jgi:CBS domain-containing protein
MSLGKVNGSKAMTIQAILDQKDHQNIYSISSQTTVEAAAAMLASRRIGALPVIDNDQICGIFSERDVIYGLAKLGTAMLAQPISSVMTAPAITVTADTPILSALSLMTRRRIRHLPVTDGATNAARVIGFISIGDLVKYRIERIENEAAAMREYIQMA